jgi:hypothetical protein
MRKFYISGPMTGLPDNNFPAFNLAAAKVRSHGYEVVNPVDINPDSSLPWEECLRADIKALCDCDGIVLIRGWQNSKGAQLELHVAHRLGLAVHLIEEFA